ncbi:MAG: hypothetical protein OK441_01640 [Thaumarchaeota archaeon]|nr:hypothetical protein [Nitrososphaerota archaeon]
MADPHAKELERRRRWIFACFMGGFLIAPFMPVEFTSILTATVWNFSGRFYALVFLVLGTFLRADSITIFSGIENMIVLSFPGFLAVGPAYLAVGVMFFGNLAAAFLFKVAIRRAVFHRIPAGLFAA